MNEIQNLIPEEQANLHIVENMDVNNLPELMKNVLSLAHTPAEQVQYEKWKAVCQEASRIAKDPNHPRYQEMCDRHMAQLKDEPNGKTTMKAYLWYVCGQEYDAAHPNG